MAHSTTTSFSSRARTIVAAFSMPWNAFVAVFLYYVALALLSVGGGNFSVLSVAVAYLAPVVWYVSMLLTRGMHALSALPIEIGETPTALQH